MIRGMVVLLLTLATATANTDQKSSDKRNSIAVGPVKVDTPKVVNTNFDYVAETVAPVARSGNVIAGTLRWRCKGNHCTISGPWPTPGLQACKQLAAQVGRISSYGHSRAQLITAQLASCNAGIPARTLSAGGSSTIAVPVLNEAAQAAARDLPPGSGNLINTLGPVITQFERISGCVYPDPDRNILRYRVNPAPDGARVRRVMIYFEYGDGEFQRWSVFSSPNTTSNAVTTAGSVADSRPSLQTRAYILQATDSRGRTSARRLDFRYLDPEPHLWFVGVDQPPLEIRSAGGTVYEYSLRIAVDNFAISAIEAPTHMTLIHRQGYDVSVPLEQVQLWEIASADGAQWSLRLPSVRFDNYKRLVLRFRAPVRNWIQYNGRQYRRWSLGLQLAIQHPRGCSASPRVVRINVPSSSPAPPPPPPAPEVDHSFTGYLSEVACECEDDISIWGVRVHACMINALAGGDVCLGAQQTYPYRVTECTVFPGTFQRLEEAPSCYPANPLPRIVETFSGDD